MLPAHTIQYNPFECPHQDRVQTLKTFYMPSGLCYAKYCKGYYSHNVSQYHLDAVFVRSVLLIF